MENLIRCQRCFEWVIKEKAISVVSNMRWANPLEIAEKKYVTMGMDINYFCPQCISIIELNNE